MFVGKARCLDFRWLKSVSILVWSFRLSKVLLEETNGLAYFGRQRKLFLEPCRFPDSMAAYRSKSSFCMVRVFWVLGHFINLTFHQLDILSTWHFINLTFHQLVIFVNLSFLSTCHFINWSFLSTWHFINLSFYQLDILSIWHFINLTFYQITISSTHHFIDLSFCPTCHFVI